MEKKETWSICGQVLQPGEKRRVTLRVPMDGQPHKGAAFPGGEGGDGSYEMPATLVCGAMPGTTLLVTAGMHSGEFAGLPAVAVTANEIDAEKASGNIIFVHCVNTSGFWEQNPRVLPEDGYNLNAGYPGKANGSPGQRIAAFFVREIFPQTDFILDLHGGSQCEQMTPLVFFPKAPRVREASLAAAKALNIGYLLESEATAGEYSYAANTLNIPGMILERGDGLLCDPDWAEADHRDIRLLLDHLGIYPALPGTRDEKLRRRVFRDVVYLETARHGMWHPAVRRQEDVKKGQLLGTVENLYGDVLEEFTAEADGHILYLTTGIALKAGDFLVAYALLDSEI